MFVAIQLTIQMCTSLLRWRLNLALQVSQGSASTFFRWSGHFRHCFVKGFFRDALSNFYWNRLIFDRQRAKNKLAQFFETRCRWMNIWCRIDNRTCDWAQILRRISWISRITRAMSIANGLWRRMWWCATPISELLWIGPQIRKKPATILLNSQLLPS